MFYRHINIPFSNVANAPGKVYYLNTAYLSYTLKVELKNSIHKLPCLKVCYG